MIKKILDFLGYISKKQSAAGVVLLEAKFAESLSLIQRQKALLAEQQTLILDLRSENIVLRNNQKEEVEEKRVIVEYDISDPTPSDTAERKAYVVQVSVFFRNILERKLNQMIAHSMSLLAETDNDRELDVMIKGVIYSFNELKKWGQAMHNEEVAYAVPDADEKEEQTLQEKLDNFEKKNS